MWWGELWAERVTLSSLAEQALEYGLGTAEELQAIANPNYVLPAGLASPYYSTAATIAGDGSFSLGYTAGFGQTLPATVTVSTLTLDESGYHDPATGQTQLLSLIVDASTPCTDGSSFQYQLIPSAPPPPGVLGCNMVGHVNGSVVDQSGARVDAQISCERTSAGLTLRNAAVHVENAGFGFDAKGAAVVGVEFVGSGDVVITGVCRGVPFRLGLHDGGQDKPAGKDSTAFDYGATSLVIVVPHANLHVRLGS